MMPSRPTLSSETDIAGRARYRQPEAVTILALIVRMPCRRISDLFGGLHTISETELWGRPPPMEPEIRPFPLSLSQRAIF